MAYQLYSLFLILAHEAGGDLQNALGLVTLSTLRLATIASFAGS